MQCTLRDDARSTLKNFPQTADGRSCSGGSWRPAELLVSVSAYSSREGEHIRDSPSTTSNLLLATPAIPDAHALSLHTVLAAERARVLSRQRQPYELL
jgi:hypothetical protein